MSFGKLDGQRPYHSIDLESSPGPLNVGPSNEERMPLSPRTSAAPQLHIQDVSDESKGAYPPRPDLNQTPSNSSTTRHGHKASSSWDVLGGIQKDWNGFDSRNGSTAAFQYAQGDAPETKAGKLYLYLLNSSIITRWIIFIIPVLALLWIPGIISLTSNPSASIWHVRLLWWSVWFSIIWGGWWAALAGAMMLPYLLRYTLGLGAVSLRKYFDWLKALQRPVAFVGWAVAVYISYNPVIHTRFTTADAKNFPSSASALTLIGRICFGLLLCSIILFGEKFAIQFVAYKFHQRSYADRIAHQKKQVECLITLYRNSTNLDRSDTLQDNGARGTGPAGSALNPARFLKRALRGVQRTAETTTTAFGNLATEIAGVSVLQPNSPAGMVSNALNSANKSRMLARRLFYSFRAEGADRLILGDIARFFPSREMATFAFEVFDKDENGDATKEELEAALLEINTERLSLAASMKDVDSATKRLDNILMTLYFFVVMLIFAIMLDTAVSSLITGAGTFLLGLSWLIGGSAQEVLTSIIFLFIKHPFDIGDGLEIDGVTYTVKEIRLLSTVLVDARGSDVQCPNTVLNTKYIMNRRRSGPMSESFDFIVGFGTNFEQLEDLRHRMLKFVQAERRDYLPVFDVMVQDISDQANMKLQASIKYKSNWQQGALKAQRRNKWICALKNALKEAKIFGPSGDPNAAAGPQQVTLVPYTEPSPKSGSSTPQTQTRDYDLADSNAALLNQGTGNIFDDEAEMRMPVPASGVASGYNTPVGLNGGGVQGAGSAQQQAVLRSRAGAAEAALGPGTMPQPHPQASRWASAEEIEMKQNMPQPR